MIKLSEILHTVRNESTTGLTPVDNWNLLHATFLEDMNFKTNGGYHYSLDNPPIKIGHKKGVGFVVEDKAKKEIHAFKEWKDLEEYFASYKQKWENAPYQEGEEEEQQENIEKSEPETKPNTVPGVPDYKSGVKKWERI